MDTKQASAKWKISTRRVGLLCQEGKIKGAYKTGKSWYIPDYAEKPSDWRVKESMPK